MFLRGTVISLLTAAHCIIGMSLGVCHWHVIGVLPHHDRDDFIGMSLVFRQAVLYV